MIHRQETVPYYQFNNMSKFIAIGHFVSSRLGGVSPPPQDTLNLSFGNGDKKKHVAENRKALASSVGISPKYFMTANQIHGTHVAIVSQLGNRQRQKNIDHHGPYHEAEGSDALVTNTSGICLMILTADCVPILLYDPVAGVVGAVHAGWKGTLGAIVQKAVHVFERDFQSDPKNIYAALGPSIGPCCFEVGPEVSETFEATLGPEDLLSGKNGKRDTIDLWTANARQLARAGVPHAHIEQANLCTCHHVDTFFSYRCEGGNTGRFGTGIFLHPRSSKVFCDRQ